MIIQLDTREQELIAQIKTLISFIPIFKDIKIEISTLPLGDIILFDDENNTSKIIIERKTINDLVASIKDGRYEEQSYRLNGLNIHNHNIMYLIEGDMNSGNRFKDNKTEKLTICSAILSLNYYKGFSVIRTFSLEETATFICNSFVKLNKERNNKKAYYAIQDVQDVQETKEEVGGSADLKEQLMADKEYVNVVKKVKKENITSDNIAEIMLCQIPGVSSVSALAIMKKFTTLSNLIKELENNPTCLHDITTVTKTGQNRKISSTIIANIKKYLVPQPQTQQMPTLIS
jgi:ERCC4-type nuclease